MSLAPAWGFTSKTSLASFATVTSSTSTIPGGDHSSPSSSSHRRRLAALAKHTRIFKLATGSTSHTTTSDSQAAARSTFSLPEEAPPPTPRPRSPTPRPPSPASTIRERRDTVSSTSSRESEQGGRRGTGLRSSWYSSYTDHCLRELAGDEDMLPTIMFLAGFNFLNDSASDVVPPFDSLPEIPDEYLAQTPPLSPSSSTLSPESSRYNTPRPGNGPSRPTSPFSHLPFVDSRLFHPTRWTRRNRNKKKRASVSTASEESDSAEIGLGINLSHDEGWTLVDVDTPEDEYATQDARPMSRLSRVTIPRPHGRTKRWIRRSLRSPSSTSVAARGGGPDEHDFSTDHEDEDEGDDDEEDGDEGRLAPSDCLSLRRSSYVSTGVGRSPPEAVRVVA